MPVSRRVSRRAGRRVSRRAGRRVSRRVSRRGGGRVSRRVSRRAGRRVSRRRRSRQRGGDDPTTGGKIKKCAKEACHWIGKRGKYLLAGAVGTSITATGRVMGELGNVAEKIDQSAGMKKLFEKFNITDANIDKLIDAMENGGTDSSGAPIDRNPEGAVIDTQTFEDLISERPVVEVGSLRDKEMVIVGKGPDRELHIRNKQSTAEDIAKGIGKLVAVITLNGGKISLKLLNKLGKVAEGASQSDAVHKLHEVAHSEGIEIFLHGDTEVNPEVN